MKRLPFHLLLSTFFSKKSGQSLIEVLIAVAIGAIMILAAAYAIAPILMVGTQSYRNQVGVALSRELADNVKVWADGDWHNINNLATTSASHYYLNASGSPFSAVSGDESVVLATTTYKRYFYVEDAKRDASDLIVSSGGVYDPSTKKVTVAYSWPKSATGTISFYLTRNRDNVFMQTDWRGGPGQDGPITNPNSRFATSSGMDYSTTTGSIVIDFP